MRVDSTLGLIAAEVERSFEGAARALQRHQEGLAGAEALEQVRLAVAQVRGVLTVADVAGAPRVLQELELLLADKAPDPGAVAARMQRVRGAMESVRRYVRGLAAGEPARPMALAEVMQALTAARGSDRPAGLDLLQVDLSQPLPDEARRPSAAAGDRAENESLRDLRALFQKGLLEWLRGGAAGLRSMGDIVGHVHAIAGEPAPWWIAAAFIDQLESGALPASVHVKRIFAGLDQYLARLCSGSAARPDSTLREMLYFIAQGDPASERVTRVRDHYAIVDPSPAARVSAPPAAVVECMRELEVLWEQAVTGDAANAQVFASRVDAALRELPDRLAPLLQALRAAAGATGSAGVPARLALEVASVLLIVEQAASASDEDSGLEAAIAAAQARLQGALDTGEAGAAAGLDPLVFSAGGALLDALAREIAAALGTAERRLAEMFADAGNDGPMASAALEAAQRALIQAQGAFRVLGDERAVQAAGFCLGETAKLAEGVPADRRSAQANLAAVVSALAFHVEGLGQDGADLAELLRRAGAPDLAGPDRDAQVSGNETTMDLDLNFLDNIPSQNSAPAGIAPVADGGEWDTASDAELLYVFVDEATAVLAQLDRAAGCLRADRRDADALATSRRGFHTLKGSGRMVELQRFSDTALAMEKLLDRSMQRGEGASDALQDLLGAAVARFGGWVEALREQGRARIDGDDLVQWADRLAHGDQPRSTQVQAGLAGASRPPAAPPATAQTDSAVVTGQANDSTSMDRAASGLAAAGSEQDLTANDRAAAVEIGTVRLSGTLFGIFVEESRRLVQALASELQSVCSASGNDRTHERFRLAHTLSGIAGTTGFPALRDLAGALETVLRAAHERELDLAADDGALFERVAAALGEMVAAVAARQLPHARADLESALRELERRGRDAMVDGRRLSVDHGPAPARAGADSSSETGVLDVAPAVRAERRRMRIQDDLDAALLPAFLEEAADLVPHIGQALRDWHAEPQRRDLQLALTRLLHTFKGGARMAGAMGLGELTHSMETRIVTAAGLPQVPDSVFEGLEVSFDRMGVLLDRIARPARSVEPTAGIDATAPEPVAADDAADVAARTGPVAPGAALARPLLRVRVDLLERLAAEAGEVAISRSRVDGEVRAMRATLRDMASGVARLHAQVREMEIQAESQIQSRQVQAGETDEPLDPLEFDRFTRLQELSRLIDESANDVATLQQAMSRNLDDCDGALAAQARMTRVLQDSLMSVRMVPFASLNERLYRVARLTAREAGRRASLDIRGSRVELDRSVVDRIAAPLEHLLRNAVVHGIETPEERRALGKPEAGEIVLDVRQEGNEVLLVLQDDGRGLDLERLCARAIDAGLIAAGARPSPEQIMQLAFAPGVTTAAEVSESAGRGVGLDVVRSEVAAVGGRVDVAFEPQRGTVFTVRLPLTLTVMQALVVRCAGQLFALPAMMVEQVRTLKPQALERVSDSGQVDWQTRRYPLHDLRELLALVAQPRAAQAFTPIALVRGGAQRAAIRVDELIGHEEVVMKDLGAQLAGVTGIVGAAVRGSGELVLILNPVRLAQRQPSPMPKPAVVESPQVAAQSATVLVVDDSLTVRKITGRVLARKGFRVIEARDGLEALDRLAVDRPALVLLDIEMPRMDGFEVLRRMRDDPRWQSLPVMMITSRTADKHRNQAFELGASAFLGKPFEEQDLLAQVADLLEGARA
jgi:chemosensory pili system protein ChpA (sensor histidine kinase/response regulator)